MIYYISQVQKRLVNRNNGVSSLSLVVDYNVSDEYSFQIITSQNQIVNVEGLSGLYFAGSLQTGQPSYDLLFLSKDYTIENNIITFRVDTYTVPFLNKIRKRNTGIAIEIGQISINNKTVLLRDSALANPRVYVAGLAPSEIESNDYWTKEETQEAIDAAISEIGISGYVTDEEFLAGLATKQDVIDEENKLGYGLLSGTPTIPTKTSDLDNDSDFVDAQYVSDATSAFITEDALDGFATEQYVDAAISGKADKDEIPTKVSELDNDEDYVDSQYVSDATSSFITDTELNEVLSGKQDVITFDNWLSAECVRTELDPWSGDPEYTVDAAINIVHQEALDALDGLSGKADKSEIPSAVSQLTNDSNFATSAYVDAEVSGKQDEINYDNPLDAHNVIMEFTDWEGDPEFRVDDGMNSLHVLIQENAAAITGKADVDAIPLSTSQLTNDSGFITEAALSTKQDLITSDNKLAYDLISGAPEQQDAAWGGITGTLSAQTDLQTALDIKADKAELDAVDEVLQNIIATQMIKVPFYIEANEENVNIEIYAYNSPDSVTLEYSNDGKSWANYNVGDWISLLNVGDKVYFRGDNINFSKDLSNYYKIVAQQSKTFNAGGNVLSLTDKAMQHQPPNFAFCNLFYGTNIVDASKLVITAISSSSHRQMFSQCTNLIKAPKIFATEVNDYSFTFMFDHCTSLIEAPDLPATTLADFCYSSMFDSCTSLTKPPIIKATSLAKSCYQSMFNGCSALIEAPILLATTLVTSCYKQMFTNCTSLNTIRVYFTNWNYLSLLSNSTGNWLSNTASSGTFYCPSGLNTSTRDATHIPEGWTVINI